MSTAAIARPRLSGPAASRRRGSSVSEWTKLRSLRSTRWSLVVGVVLTIALPVPLRGGDRRRTGRTCSPHERADRHPLDIALAGVNLVAARDRACSACS